MFLSLPDAQTVSILVDVVIAVAIAVSGYAVSRWMRRYFYRRMEKEAERKQFLNALYLLLRTGLYLSLLILFFIIVLIPLGYGEELIRVTRDFITAKGHVIALIIGILLVGWILIKLANVFFESFKTYARLDVRILNITSIAVKFLIYAIVTVILIQVVLSAIGLPEIAGTVVTIFSVLIGIAVSFAATGSVGNLLAGLLLMSWRPFKEGDRVEVGGGVFGDVLEVTLTYVKIRTIKDEIIHVSNLQVIGNRIINYSGLPMVILHTNVTLGYDVDRRIAEEALLEAANMTWGVVKEGRKPFVLIRSLDQYYVTYELNAFTDKPNRMVEIYSNLHKNILDVFSKRGIKILSPMYVRFEGLKQSGQQGSEPSGTSPQPGSTS
ncbi:MAG: mechanosensitive ion channel family protein [Thermoproteota archaeon]